MTKMQPANSRLTLDAQPLLQRTHHFGLVAPVFHHPVNILVGTANLVENAVVLPADDAGRPGAPVGLAEGRPGPGAWLSAAGRLRRNGPARRAGR